MAPLSVHSSAGGTTRAVPTSKAIRASTFRIASLAATPPAATKAVGAPKRARNIFSPQRSRSATTSTTACWNEAQRSRTSCALMGAIFSASSRSAVFNPDKEKSALSLPSIGRGSAKRAGLPSRASFSTSGPPG